MPWTRLSVSCSSSSSSVCSRTKLCLRRGSAFSIGDGAQDEPERLASYSRSASRFFSFPVYLRGLPITIELPDLASQTRFNLARWTEMLTDQDLAKLPNRVEPDRH